MHKNNFRGRHKRMENRLDETVRIASIVQKGMTTGRSSYVEMRALERIVKHNINTSVQIIRSGPASKDSDVSDLLSKILTIHGGYPDTLTPNGVLRKNELDRLLSIDSEISICLGMLESIGNSRPKTRDVAATLRELIEERKKLVGSLRA
jgi:hypothetical protein